MAIENGATPFVRLLGGASIEVGGETAAGRAAHRHPIALLALLVASRGRAISRDKLISYLWPERDNDAGRNLLKVAVHGLRKEFGDGAIRSVGDQLSIDPSVIRSDVGEFLRAVEAGDDDAIVARYGGPFLDGFFIKDAGELERWIDGQRASLAGSYLSAVERLATRAELAGDLDAAIRWQRAHLAVDPYNADIARRHVRALVASSDRAAAIQFAEALVRRRENDLGIGDEDQIVSLARTVAGTFTAPREIQPPATQQATLTSASTPAPASTGDLKDRQASSAMWGARALVATVALAAVVYAARGHRARAEPIPPALRPTAVARVVAAPFRDGDTNTHSSIVNNLGDAVAALLNSGAATPAPAWRGGIVASTDSALRIARSSGAGALLLGDVSRTRDSTSVTATLYDVATRGVLATASTAWPSTSAAAGAAERLATQLAVVVSGEPADRAARLRGRSFAAVQSYLAGQRAYQSARYAEAESLFARALDADTTFGVAGLGLALANSWTGINDHYGRGRDVAKRYRSALSRRDAAFFDAYFAPDPSLGAPRAAPVYLAAWEDLVEKWPDWRDAWYELGDRYYHFGGLSGLVDPGERARTAFRRAVDIDPTFVAPLHHLVELYAARGERDAVRTTGERYFAANPSVDRNAGAIGWEIAMATGDSAWLERVRANLPRLSREDLVRIAWVTDANGWPRVDAERAAAALVSRSTVTSEREAALKVQFTLSVNAGQPSKAYAAAAGLGDLFPDRPVAAIWELLAALFSDPDSAGAADASRRLESFVTAPLDADHVRRDQEYLAQCLVGYWRATTGNEAEARALSARLHASIPLEKNNFVERNARVCVAMLDAVIAVRGRSPRARASVTDLDSILLRLRVPPHVTLEIGTLVAARLHATLGDTVDALNAARRREHVTGDPMFLASQLAEEGRLAEESRDTAGAVRAYRHYIALRPAAESRAPAQATDRVRAALGRLANEKR